MTDKDRTVYFCAQYDFLFVADVYMLKTSGRDVLALDFYSRCHYIALVKMHESRHGSAQK